MVVLPVLAGVLVLAGALVLAGVLVVVVVDVGVAFPNTLLEVSVELLLPPNMFGLWGFGNPKGEGLVPVVFENAVLVFVPPPPNPDF